MIADDPSQSSPGKTVLLVDDESMVLEVGKAILQRLGYRVVTAESGEAAVKHLQEARDVIGCAVLDLTMPGMDGKETLVQLRALAPELPVVISSGLAIDQVAGQFKGIPGIAVIQKPYQVADLSATIQDLLAASR